MDDSLNAIDPFDEVVDEIGLLESFDIHMMERNRPAFYFACDGSMLLFNPPPPIMVGEHIIPGTKH